MRRPRRWCLLAAVLVAALAIASPAGAHAVLVSSEPSDLSSVTTTARELHLVFSEPVRPGFARLVVRRIDGLRVAAHPRVHGREVRASLPTLRRGTYVVDWTVMAVGDSHVSEGIVVFGAGVRAAAVPHPTPAGPPLGDVLLRWLDLSFLALLVGSLAVGTVVLGAGTHRRRALSTAMLAGAIALGTGTGLLARQAWQLADGSHGEAPGLGWQLLRSGWGAEWTGRQALIVALVAIAALSRSERARPYVLATTLVPLAAGLALVQALSSHANALSSSRPLAVTLEATHLLAAAVWIGGLVALQLALRSAGPGVARAAWRRFAIVAAAAVATLAATGLYLAGRQVASLDALATTVYGQALVVKAMIVAGAGAIGVANYRALRRRSALRLLTVEAVIGIAVVLAAAVITAATPARGPEFAPAPASPANTRASSRADLLVTLTVTPNRPGTNVYDIRVVSSRVPPPAPVRSVRLRFDRSGSASVVTAPLQRIGANRYRLAGTELGQAGAWQVTAAVERPGLPTSRAGLPWAVGPTASARGVVLSNRPLGPFLVGAAAAVAGLALIVLAVAVRRSRPRGPRGVTASASRSTS